MKTLIIGKRSFISKELRKVIPNSTLISADEFVIKNLKNHEKINIIINSFYPVAQLNNIENYRDFIDKSILSLSKILDKIKPKTINKILYTSSSVVYGSIIDNPDQKDTFNRNLYSYTKLCCENLLKNFCDKNNLNLLIARVFNCYSSNNNFSVINKILESLKNSKKITINNEGNSIRDFIHVNDVAKIYLILIKKFKKGTFDVGTGNGIKIKDLLKRINFPEKNIKYRKKYNEEIDFSVANLDNYKEKLKNFNFKKIENFFKIKTKLKKYYSDNLNKLQPKANNTLIYGAGYAGKKIAKDLILNKKLNFLYFVDDDNRKVGRSVYGKKIISFNQLISLSKKIKIDKILIAIPSLDPNDILKLYNKIFPLTENISSLPNKEYYKNKKVNFEDLIELNVEEILNRKIFQINLKKLSKYRNKTILITGGAGSIGSEICKQLILCKPKKIIIIDQSEYNIYLLNKKLSSKKIKTYLIDINNTKILREIILKRKVDYIFHAAAYKHVDLLENNHISAIKNNFIGTLSILRAIKNLNINLSIISTDKAVFPKSILGLTKRASEIIARNFSNYSNYKYVKINIVRFGNVFGSQGSAIETFVDQILNKKKITITSYNMKRYFMSIREACNLVIQSAALEFKNKIFILDMGKQIKIINLIKKILDFYKKNIDDFKIVEIGIKKGEKNSESLSYVRKIIKTKIKKLMISEEKTKKIKNLGKKIDFIEQLIANNNSKKAVFEIKKLTKI